MISVSASNHVWYLEILPKALVFSFLHRKRISSRSLTWRTRASPAVMVTGMPGLCATSLNRALMFACASHTPRTWVYTVSYRTQGDVCSNELGEELGENATKAGTDRVSVCLFLMSLLIWRENRLLLL